MRVIGGLIAWKPGVPVTDASLRAMVGPLPTTTAVIVTGTGSAGFFTSHAEDPVGGIHGVDIVADLDLTNMDELRAATGVASERDVLAELYAADGADFVRRLRGAFAIALLDRRTMTLVLATDHFGIKRMYYVTNERRTVFATRSTALRQVPGVSGAVDSAGVYAYLNFGYVPAAVTIFQGIRRLPPGHALVVQSGRAVLQEYWDLAYRESAVTAHDAAAAVYRYTEEAVSRTLRGRSLKDTGAFLSGGTDSSTVVGLMSRLTGERINTFSIGFAEARYDELGYAELTARHFNTSHYTHVITPDEALSHLPTLVEAYDEPFGNNSAIGTLACARLARNAGVKWLLAGDGGDEVFGGNERYRTDRILARYQRVPAVLRHGMLEPLLFGLPDGRSTVLGRAQRYVQRANLANPRRFYSYEFFFARHAAEWLAPDFLASVADDGPYTVLQEQYDRVRASSELNRLLYLDLKLTIGDNDLLKVMRTADVACIRARFPLLDVSLVEFLGTLPAELKVRGTEKRFIFKRAFADLLPVPTLAKRKHGFGVPTSVWLRSHARLRELARDALLSPRAAQRGFFRRGATERLFELHDAEATPYYGDLLWMLLMLELWHQQHVDRRSDSR